MAPDVIAAEVLIEPGHRTRLREGLAALWTYRGTIMAFAERNIQLRYAQAVLGVGWALLQPLAFLGIFVLFFARFARLETGGPPYAVSTLAALIGWMYVATTVSFAATSLVDDAALVRKVWFPREAPVLAAALAAGVDFLAGLAAFVLLSPLLGGQLGITALAAPFFLLGLVPPALGVGLALAALNAYYRDFRYTLSLGIQLWMFASPVAYPLGQVPESWRLIYVFLNPAAGAIHGLSETLAGGALPAASVLLVSGIGGLIWLTIGLRIFKAFEPDLADVL